MKPRCYHSIPAEEVALAPAASWLKVTGFTALGVILLLWASPPFALLGGMVFAFVAGNPFPQWTSCATKWLLQTGVVLLGFGMNLPTVLHFGINGSLFAAVTIVVTLALGWWLGRKLGVEAKTTLLISAGTAICGGSAIAAVSAVIAATESEIAVSIGTVFLLNAVALYVFPLVGHGLHLSQEQFGLWSGAAIHDISAVVGASLSYGAPALDTAVAVKLSRTLWIIPLTLVLAASAARHRQDDPTERKVTIPWFIGLFLLASVTRSYFPPIQSWSLEIVDYARRGMALALFLVGISLSFRTLRAVGWKTVIIGLLLWGVVSTGSLLAIHFFAAAI
ncbi:MAG: putative sulfate exporter family transporter [Chthoniobacteraceae bacterium]